jgi:hypothetical protein
MQDYTYFSEHTYFLFRICGRGKELKERTAYQYDYSGRGKFMPLPLKSKILETPGPSVTDDIKMFPFAI